MHVNGGDMDTDNGCKAVSRTALKIGLWIFLRKHLQAQPLSCHGRSLNHFTALKGSQEREDWYHTQVCLVNMNLEPVYFCIKTRNGGKWQAYRQSVAYNTSKANLKLDCCTFTFKWTSVTFKLLPNKYVRATLSQIGYLATDESLCVLENITGHIDGSVF